MRSRRPLSARLALVGALSLAAACRVVSETPEGELSVTTDLRPTRVSVRQFEDGLDLTVRATNAGPRRIVVPLGGPAMKTGATAGESEAVGFGLRVVRTDGAPIAMRFLPPEDTAVTLNAGATLRQQFHLDFGTGTPGALPPGDYDVIGSFGRTEAPPVRLRVRP